MIAIILLALGAISTTFGYLIYFKKKYSLINDFDYEYKAGRRTEKYAERIGIIEFISGIFLIVAGIIAAILNISL